MTADLTAIDAVVDLDRYPVHDLDGEAGRALVARCRADLDTTGACQLPGFLRPAAVDALVAEALGERDRAWRTDDRHNVYFEQVEDAAPAGSALRALEHTSKSAVAWDLVDADSPLRVAYEWDGLTAFLGAALGVTPFHRYADPLGAASLMLFDTGDELGWHFDRSPFAVTVMLQTPDAGGAFEYHHHLRTPDDENEAGVLAALAGTGPTPVVLDAEPGTLAMFQGHSSLHRVTPVGGPRPRINAVLAYSERPGDTMNALTQQLFYGRTA